MHGPSLHQHGYDDATAGGNDTTTPDSLSKNVLRRPMACDPGGSVISNVVSPPATMTSPSSMIGKKLMGGGGAMETNVGGGVSSLSSVGGAGASSKLKVKKKATDFFPDKAHVTDALRTILADLEASHLTLVYEKHMEVSDRNKGQNRLLMSCRSEAKKAYVGRIFTETETTLVEQQPPKDEEHGSNDNSSSKGKGKGKGKKKKKKKKGSGEDKMNKKGKTTKRCCNNNDKLHKTNDDDGKKEEDDNKQQQQQGKQLGLDVEAYDCDGRPYKVKLRYLPINEAYRIIGPNYTVFLKNNNLLVVGDVTPKPPSAGEQRQKKRRRRSSLSDEEEAEPPNDEPAAVRDDAAADIQMEVWAFRSPKLSVGEKDQPDGALGLLLLHYDRGGGGNKAGVEEEDQEVPQHVADDDDEVDLRLGTLEKLFASWLSFHCLR